MYESHFERPDNEFIRNSLIVQGNVVKVNESLLGSANDILKAAIKMSAMGLREEFRGRTAEFISRRIYAIPGMGRTELVHTFLGDANQFGSSGYSDYLACWQDYFKDSIPAASQISEGVKDFARDALGDLDAGGLTSNALQFQGLDWGVVDMLFLATIFRNQTVLDLGDFMWPLFRCLIFVRVWKSGDLVEMLVDGRLPSQTVYILMGVSYVIGGFVAINKRISLVGPSSQGRAIIFPGPKGMRFAANVSLVNIDFCGRDQTQVAHSLKVGYNGSRVDVFEVRNCRFILQGVSATNVKCVKIFTSDFENIRRECVCCACVQTVIVSTSIFSDSMLAFSLNGVRFIDVHESYFPQMNRVTDKDDAIVVPLCGTGSKSVSFSSTSFDVTPEKQARRKAMYLHKTAKVEATGIHAGESPNKKAKAAKSPDEKAKIEAVDIHAAKSPDEKAKVEAAGIHAAKPPNEKIEVIDKNAEAEEDDLVVKPLVWTDALLAEIQVYCSQTDV